MIKFMYTETHAAWLSPLFLFLCKFFRRCTAAVYLSAFSGLQTILLLCLFTNCMIKLIYTITLNEIKLYFMRIYKLYENFITSIYVCVCVCVCVSLPPLYFNRYVHQSIQSSLGPHFDSNMYTHDKHSKLSQ